jgi:hypothetical protein
MPYFGASRTKRVSFSPKKVRIPSPSKVNYIFLIALKPI